MSVRTTDEFKKLPIGKVCMVYFHSIDIVLGREQDRKAWQARCHLPKMLFVDKKGRKKGRVSKKLQDYGLFKRMLAVKEAVYKGHKRMLHLYEKFCDEAEVEKYWGDDEDEDEEVVQEDIPPAAETNEADCEDEF